VSGKASELETESHTSIQGLSTTRILPVPFGPYHRLARP
jgi:hypothetical protein